MPLGFVPPTPASETPRSRRVPTLRPSTRSTRTCSTTASRWSRSSSRVTTGTATTTPTTSSHIMLSVHARAALGPAAVRRARTRSTARTRTPRWCSGRGRHQCLGSLQHGASSAAAVAPSSSASPAPARRGAAAAPSRRPRAPARRQRGRRQRRRAATGFAREAAERLAVCAAVATHQVLRVWVRDRRYALLLLLRVRLLGQLGSAPRGHVVLERLTAIAGCVSLGGVVRPSDSR